MCNYPSGEVIAWNTNTKNKYEVAWRYLISTWVDYALLVLKRFLQTWPQFFFWRVALYEVGGDYMTGLVQKSYEATIKVLMLILSDFKSGLVLSFNLSLPPDEKSRAASFNEVSAWDDCWSLVWRIFRVKLIEIVMLWVYDTIPYGFSLFRHFLSITFHLFKYFIWLRITDEGSVTEMCIWSIL